MKSHSTILMLSGAWLSLLALVIGGSILLPEERTASGQSLALLYKFAARDRIAAVAEHNEQGRSMIANLDDMVLSLYEEGVLIKSFPILSKGRPGTPWETPTGRYTIQLKEKKHYSSIGHTWMPYSMQFYGNFFIHGWPTYENGKAVPLGYSGGCIRLDTDDAREVYDFIPKGVTVYVKGGAAESDFATSSRYYLRGEGAPPNISAGAFIVADASSGSVLWERDSSHMKSAGGLTQMMTALTAVEVVNQYKIVRMSEILLGESVVRKHKIGAVDEMPVGTLIYPLLFDTNDTAGKVFASVHGKKQFMRYMNEKAQAIGMTDTAFSGPLSGDLSTTTARDVFALIAYVKNSKRFLLDVTLTPNKVLSNDEGEDRYEWQNRNPWIMSGDSAFRGGVAAIDDAGRGSAMLLFEVPLAEFGSRTIAFVVLDATHLEEDVLALRKFIETHFVYGAQRESGTFIREEGEAVLDFIQKAKHLLDLDRDLREADPPNDA